MKKGGFVKDAIILFAITLISGILLGGVYQITKEPIRLATIAANNKAYRTVFSEAESFENEEALTASIAACNEALAEMDYGNVSVAEVLNAKDAGGNSIGYVVVAQSKDGYNGVVKLSVGLKADGTITGIAFLEISETPGLGLKAKEPGTEKEPGFMKQFPNKNFESLEVVKTGNAKDNQINAISGATITSNATTNAVNAALYYLHNCVNQ